MKKILLVLGLFLIGSLSVRAQTPVSIVNPSFEANPPAGNYNINVCPQAWTCQGQYYGMQNSTPAQVASGIDGKTVAWLQNGSITQDVGPSAANTSYSVTVMIGSQNGFYGNYTVSYAGCSISGATTVGSLVPITLPCPTPTGELIISLTATNGQVLFDNVLLTAQSTVPPIQNIVTVSISTTYDDGSIPTILTVNVNDVTTSTTVNRLSLTPDPVTGAASGVFTLINTETYQVALIAAGSQIGEIFYEGGLVLGLMPQLSQANFSVVLFKATGAIKSFNSGAQ